jgi:hypothetical protein
MRAKRKRPPIEAAKERRVNLFTHHFGPATIPPRPWRAIVLLLHFFDVRSDRWLVMNDADQERQRGSADESRGKPPEHSVSLSSVYERHFA